MSIFRQVARGVVVSWAATLASILAGFFMSPFLIHHLGVAGYGIWILVQSTISYMYLMELGLRTTIIRLVSRDYTNANHEQVSKIISAAVWVRCWSGVAVVLITSVIAALLPHLPSIPRDEVAIARTALLLLGFTFAGTLVFSVFSATLMAIDSFDILATLELLQIILTTAGLVPVVKTGHGVVGMAAWYFASVTAVNLVTFCVCLSHYPQLKLRATRVPERELLKSLWNVGLYILAFNIAGQLIFYTDNLVVGTFVSAAAVAYYAVAGRMVDYLRQVAGAILKYFMPLASSFEARQQFDKLEQLQIRGTQVVLFVTLPIVVTLFVRGGTFLGLWIGPEFRHEATGVLMVLVAAAALMLMNVASNSLAIAMGRQQRLAYLTMVEGVANLAMSITLARSIGIMGVAIGTAVPSAIMQIFVWPRFTSRLLKSSQPRFFREVWLLPSLAMVPFTAASYALETYWHPRNLWEFLGQTLTLLPLAAGGVLLVFRKKIPQLLQYARIRKQSTTDVASSARPLSS